MKIVVSIIVLMFLITGCSTSAQKFSRANYSAIDGLFTPPINTQLTQVMGLPHTPYQSVCRQQIHRKNWWGIRASDRTSSSAYLDGGVLLTAAHNFGDSMLSFSKATDFHLECQTGYASAENEILVYDSYQKGADELEFIHPDYSFTFAFLNKRFGKDAALVKLCPLQSNNNSAFRLATLAEIASFVQSANAGSKPQIFVAGYPHGMPSMSSPATIGGKFDGARLMHVDTFARQVSSDGVIHYGFSNTVSGMSGGPVWIEKNSPQGKKYIIVGVHVTNGGAFLLDKTIIEMYQKLRSQGC